MLLGPHKAMERIKWVDGLRGIACFLVAFNHFFNGDIRAPFRTFWAEPAEENRHIFQLPPIRFLWAMDPMVPLFMVASGYSISQALLNTRDARPYDFSDRLRSAICRRPLRIFAPMLALAVVCQFIFFVGLYTSYLPEEVTTRIQPWTSPWAHVSYLCGYTIDLFNIFLLQWNHALNGHLWTMTLQFRGSYIIYFLVFVQAPWQLRVRLWCLGLMIAYVLWYGQWDIFCFISGLGLAELHALPTFNSRRSNWTVSYVLRLSTALYLLCIAGEDDYPPDYRLLRVLQPEGWNRYGNWVDVRKMWHSIGALLLFSIMLESRHLQSFLATRLPQYLGRLSFPIYLIHLAIYQICKWPVQSIIWYLLEHSRYPGPWEASEKMGSFLVTYILSGFIIAPVVIVTAELYAQFLDPHFADFARWVDGQINDKSEYHKR